MNQIVVKKFGGSSVSSLERIDHVADLLSSDVRKGEKPVVIMSAMGGQTAKLIEMAETIGGSEKGVAYDMLLASGEQVSISLLCLALEKRGLKAYPLLAHQLGIQTDSFFSKARIKKIQTDSIYKCLKEGRIPLIAGFQGVTKTNEITTLGRGGSDITATAIASALGQKLCEIYTDVPQVFNADPRLVKEAKALTFISYEDMMEMSSLGSKALHARCVEIALKANLKIHVKSTFKPNEEGTWIVPQEEIMETSLISAVCHQEDVVVVKISEMKKDLRATSDLFKKIADHHISIDVITHNKQMKAMAFSIDKQDIEAMKKLFHEVESLGQASFLEDVVKISIVGTGMISYPGVAWKFFETFERNDVEIHLLTTSEIKMSAIVHKKYLQKIAADLHKQFELT